MGMFKRPIPRLGPEDIEVKVKQVGAKGAVALLYKTARTDMRILDECAGPENWQDKYQEIKGNLYCTILVKNEETGEWIGKTDCGIESREDNEGNQKKGEASDAFKRAGFKWGIGRELYSAPFIFLKIETEEVSGGNGKKRYELKNRFARFAVKSIGYSEDGAINFLLLTDDKGGEVYRYGSPQKADIESTAKPTQQQIGQMRVELQRTGWSVEKAMANVSAKFGRKIEEPELTAEQCAWLLGLLARKPEVIE